MYDLGPLDDAPENYYEDLEPEGPEEERRVKPYRPHSVSPSHRAVPASPQLLYRPDQHTSTAFQRLVHMRDENKLCDVVVKVGGLSFNAHRAVLAACSPYFEAMFSREMRETLEGIVTIVNFEPDAMKSLIDFCYDPCLTITLDNVMELLPGACLLQMTGIQKACCTFLASQLHPSNALGYCKFADMHSCAWLQNKCIIFLQQRFPEVALHEEFLELTFEEAKGIVSDSRLNVRGEEQVYEAAISWIKHDVAKRRGHLADLLSCVRMPLMSAAYLSREVKGQCIFVLCSTTDCVIFPPIPTMTKIKPAELLHCERCDIFV